MHTRLLLVCAAACLCGCGYVGDPLPPALNIPLPVKDLAVTQRAAALIVDFTAPALTVEDLAIREFDEIDLRVGAIPSPFSMEAWAAQAKLVPATAEPGKPVRVETSGREWIGSEVLVAVRLKTSRGRASDWSNSVTLMVKPPLPPPSALTAEPHPEGVRIGWEPVQTAESYRIFRHVEGGQAPVEGGTTKETHFIDRTAGMGRPLTYSVQALASGAESEPSSTVTVVPRDIFAPSAPAALMALAGVGSVELTWDRSREPDLKIYRVYRAEGTGEFALLADAVDAPAYSDRQITAGTLYRYQVTAVDAAGNESPRSAAIEITGPA
jgi:hypothetical protein